MNDRPSDSPCDEPSATVRRAFRAYQHARVQYRNVVDFQAERNRRDIAKVFRSADASRYDPDEKEPA